MLLFTSGTSGRPKGAMLSHRALLANIEQLAALDDPPVMRPDDVVLVLLPLFHSYALNAVLGLLAHPAPAQCSRHDRTRARRCGWCPRIAPLWWLRPRRSTGPGPTSQGWPTPCEVCG